MSQLSHSKIFSVFLWMLVVGIYASCVEIFIIGSRLLLEHSPYLTTYVDYRIYNLE